MNKTLKTVLTAGVLTVISIGALWFAQRLLMPKYQRGVIEGSFTEEYYKEKVPHDVLIFGDCDAYENFSPIKMYEDYGISAYIRGSGEQYIWQSYYLLEDALRIETPEIVVVSVHSVQFNEPRFESYNRMTLDGMQWSPVKVDAINASMMEGETFLSYVFPILRYHERWSELTPTDWQCIFSKEITSHNGYYMRCDVKPYVGYPIQQPLLDTEFGDNAMYYLQKIVDLCEEKGITLILVRAPLEYGWYPEWDENIQEFADANGVTYLNFNDYKDEMGLDLNTDTYDAGIHLNIFGAEKLSSFFGDYLVSNYDLTDYREVPEVAAVYAEKIEFYDFMKEDQLSEIEQYGELVNYGANAIEN